MSAEALPRPAALDARVRRNALALQAELTRMLQLDDKVRDPATAPSHARAAANTMESSLVRAAEAADIFVGCV